MSSEEQELVSIIMPSFNSGRYIESSIRSVMAQIHDGWELIVVDDCSTDDTPAVVTRLQSEDSRIKLLRLEINHGAPAAPRNIGVKAAAGEWVAFLDSDDIWHPAKLHYQLEALQRENGYFCSTRMTTFVDEERISFTNPSTIRVESISFVQNRIKSRIPTSSVIIKRSAKLSHPFNEESRYKAVEDYDCWLRIHQSAGPSIKLDFPFLYYRHIEGQISGSKLIMMKRVFMVHRHYKGSNVMVALFFTVTHIFGGIFHRYIRKGL